MPLPNPKPREQQSDFLARCMSLLASEFPDEKQRYAVCVQRWRNRRKPKIKTNNKIS